MTELIIVVGVAAIGAIWYFNRNSKGFDVDGDGKVDAKDLKAAVSNTVTGVKASAKTAAAKVKSAADVNKDGKIDSADAKAAADKVKTAVKKTAAKAKEAVRRGRKPKSKA